MYSDRIQCASMNALLISLITAVLLRSLCAKDSEKCRLFVTKDSIADSWQSSSLNDYLTSITCFKNQTGNRVGTYRFLHTKQGKDHTDNGSHWFVIKLQKPEWISSVSFKARNVQGQNNIADLNARAANINIWTTQADIDFGPEHCSNKNISCMFYGSPTGGTWNFCGKTPSNVSSGDTLTVPCMATEAARMILISKDVSNETIPIRKCMNFVNMWITWTLPVKTEFRASNGTEIDEAKENTSLTVRCRGECLADVPTINLTNTDRKITFTDSNRSISRVIPSDAGNYSCSIGSVALSSKYLRVLYPPKDLQIMVDSSNCDIVFNNLTITFRSSASVPTPQHRCTAFDGLKVNYTELTYNFNRLLLSHSLESFWTCHNCCAIVKYSVLTIDCIADQSSVPWYSGISMNISETLNSAGESYPPVTVIQLAILASTVGAMASVIILVLIKRNTGAQEVQESVSTLVAADEVSPSQLEILDEIPATPYISAVHPANFYDAMNDCTYVSLVPKSNEASLPGMGDNSQRVSDVTDFIAITSDGV